jgi:hypothetical protein
MTLQLLAALGWADARRRIKRIRVRPSHAGSATSGSAYAGSLIVRRSLSSCVAVLDGGPNAIKSSFAILFRASKQTRVEFRCDCSGDTSSCSDVLANRPGPDQQSNSKMDAGVGPRRWEGAGASFKRVSLVQNIRTGGGVRGPRAERRRSPTKIRVSDNGQVRFFVSANVGDRVAAKY